MSAILSMHSNIDAERFFLGSILLDDSHFAQAMLKAEDFSLEKHRLIYRRMGEIVARGETVDSVGLAHELRSHGELESCDGLSYLASLTDGLPQIPSLNGYTRLIREAATLRQIAFAGQNLSNAAMKPGADSATLLKSASTQFLSLAASQPSGEMENPHEILRAEIERTGIDTFFSGGTKGIETPVSWLNETILGLQNGDLIIIGARPSVGKTALAMQMAHKAAVDGHRCIFFSLEVGKAGPVASDCM